MSNNRINHVMIISFEIPTNKPEELSYIADIASESRFKFSVCLNGKDFSPADEIKTSNLIAFHWPMIITEPCVSMMELRKAAAMRACEFHPDIRVICGNRCNADSNPVIADSR